MPCNIGKGVAYSIPYPTHQAMNTTASSLNEIRNRAAAIFAQDDGIAAVSLQTFLGLVYVNTKLEIIDHADAVRRGLTDPIN